MRKTVMEVVKNLVFSIILTTICIILSAVLMTYLKSGFDLALYLVQCAIIIPCVVVSFKIKNTKLVCVNSILYIIVVLSAIFFSVSEFTFNKNTLYFVIIVILSSLFGHLFRKYFIYE